MALAILGMASLLLVVQSSGITSAAYEVLQLERIRDDWVRANYQLESDAASLQSLARVEAEAVGRLKMVPPDRPLFIQVTGSPSQPPGPMAPGPGVGDVRPAASVAAPWQLVISWVSAWF